MSQVRQDLRLLLELTGMIEIVAEAADGRQAIELAGVLRPDVVLMDLAMPVMDGFTATREIKERGSARRIVVLSVHGEAESLQLALEAGADALVIKGAPLGALVNAILIAQD
jgi:DNA-binding NarL/FixJ family response regulator